MGKCYHFATSVVISNNIYCYFQEALTSTVDLLDMLGMYLVITKLLGRSELKVLVTAVGKKHC